MASPFTFTFKESMTVIESLFTKLVLLQRLFLKNYSYYS